MPKWKPGKIKNDTVAVRRYMTVHVNKQGGAEGLDVAPWVEKESDVSQKTLAAKKSGKSSASKKGKQTIEKDVSSVTFTALDINRDTTIGARTDKGMKDTSGEVLRAKEVITVERPKVDDTKVFDVVEQMPEFAPCSYEVPVYDEKRQVVGSRTKACPGGQSGLLQFIGDHLKYPTIAEENGIQGRVVCTFVVERDGSVTDVQVARSIDPTLDMEAVRVLKEMPKWKPGKQSGSAVRVKYTLPVTFKLQ